MDIQLKEELQELHSSLIQQKKQKEETDESIFPRRDIEDKNKKLGQLQLEGIHQEKLLGEYEEELETRKMILKFIGLDEKDIFDQTTIETSSI